MTGKPEGDARALQTWRPLTGVIEERWRERFGQDLMDQLREAMQSMVEKAALDYPDCLPILGHELLNKASALKSRAPHHAGRFSAFDDGMAILLSKLLLAFAVEFERDSGLSLAVSANVLRLTGDEAVRVRDLPRLSRVSKEAIAMALRRAEECGLGVVQNESACSREKMFALTQEGQRAREMYRERVRKIEKCWKVTLAGRTSRNYESRWNAWFVPEPLGLPLYGKD